MDTQYAITLITIGEYIIEENRPNESKLCQKIMKMICNKYKHFQIINNNYCNTKWNAHKILQTLKESRKYLLNTKKHTDLHFLFTYGHGEDNKIITSDNKCILHSEIKKIYNFKSITLQVPFTTIYPFHCSGPAITQSNSQNNQYYQTEIGTIPRVIVSVDIPSVSPSQGVPLYQTVTESLQIDTCILIKMDRQKRIVSTVVDSDDGSVRLPWHLSSFLDILECTVGGPKDTISLRDMYQQQKNVMKTLSIYWLDQVIQPVDDGGYIPNIDVEIKLNDQHYIEDEDQKIYDRELDTINRARVWTQNALLEITQFDQWKENELRFQLKHDHKLISKFIGMCDSQRFVQLEQLIDDMVPEFVGDENRLIKENINLLHSILREMNVNYNEGEIKAEYFSKIYEFLQRCESFNIFSKMKQHKVIIVMNNNQLNDILDKINKGTDTTEYNNNTVYLAIEEFRMNIKDYHSRSVLCGIDLENGYWKGFIFITCKENELEVFRSDIINVVNFTDVSRILNITPAELLLVCFSMSRGSLIQSLLDGDKNVALEILERDSSRKAICDKIQVQIHRDTRGKLLKSWFGRWNDKTAEDFIANIFQFDPYVDTESLFIFHESNGSYIYHIIYNSVQLNTFKSQLIRTTSIDDKRGLQEHEINYFHQNYVSHNFQLREIQKCWKSMNNWFGALSQYITIVQCGRLNHIENILRTLLFYAERIIANDRLGSGFDLNLEEKNISAVWEWIKIVRVGDNDYTPVLIVELFDMERNDNLRLSYRMFAINDQLQVTDSLLNIEQDVNMNKLKKQIFEAPYITGNFVEMMNEKHQWFVVEKEVGIDEKDEKKAEEKKDNNFHAHSGISISGVEQQFSKKSHSKMEVEYDEPIIKSFVSNAGNDINYNDGLENVTDTMKSLSINRQLELENEFVSEFDNEYDMEQQTGNMYIYLDSHGNRKVIEMTEEMKKVKFGGDMEDVKIENIDIESNKGRKKKRKKRKKQEQDVLLDNDKVLEKDKKKLEKRRKKQEENKVLKPKNRNRHNKQIWKKAFDKKIEKLHPSLKSNKKEKKRLTNGLKDVSLTVKIDFENMKKHYYNAKWAVDKTKIDGKFMYKDKICEGEYKTQGKCTECVKAHLRSYCGLTLKKVKISKE